MHRHSLVPPTETPGQAETDRLYVVTRADLPIGVQAAQAVHAMAHFAHEHRLITAGWIHLSNFLVVVTTLDEPCLERFGEQVLRSGIRVAVVREPDLDDQLTAIAVEPGPVAKRLCARLPLLGKGYGYIRSLS